MSSNRMTRLAAEGMTCSNCADTVADALADTEGVEDAGVNYATEEATVSFDESETDLPSLAAVVSVFLAVGVGRVVALAGRVLLTAVTHGAFAPLF